MDADRLAARRRQRRPGHAGPRAASPARSGRRTARAAPDPAARRLRAGRGRQRGARDEPRPVPHPAHADPADAGRHPACQRPRRRGTASRSSTTIRRRSSGCCWRTGLRLERMLSVSNLRHRLGDQARCRGPRCWRSSARCRNGSRRLYFGPSVFLLLRKPHVAARSLLGQDRFQLGQRVTDDRAGGSHHRAANDASGTGTGPCSPRLRRAPIRSRRSVPRRRR